MTRHLAAAALLCALLMSCGGGTEPGDIDVGDIVVAPNPVLLMQEHAVQLQVSVLDPDGALLTGMPVAFSSADTATATVSSVGLVTSAGQAGTTSIAVKAGNKTQVVPVTVSATSSSIVIGPDPLELNQLGRLQLEPMLIDIAGDPIPGATFDYFSSDPALASVSSTGLVNSPGPAGKATITVTSGDIQATGAVTVRQVPTSVRLTPERATMARGGSVQFTTTVLDAVDQPINGGAASVTYSASPSTLLSISTSGLLTASDQVGTGSVTATSESLSASATVDVADIGSLTGSILYHIPAAGAPYGVAASSLGAILGVGIQGTIHLGNVASGSLQSLNVSPFLTIGAAFNTAGDRAYVTGAGPDGLMEFDAATGARLRSWDAGDDQLFDVVLSLDEQTIFVAGSSGAIHPIDATTFVAGTPFASDGHGVTHLAQHPTQPLIFASGTGHAREVNTETGATRSFPVGSSAQASAVALAGDRLFVAGEGGVLDVVTLSTGLTASVTIPDCYMYDIVATPGGEALLATCTSSGTVKLIDVESFAVVLTIPVGGDPRRAAISPDGSRAVVANQSGWFDIIQ